MRAHLLRVLFEPFLARILGRRFERFEVGLQRHLGVDDDVLAAGQLHPQVGTQLAVVVRRAACWKKSQRSSIPAISTTRLS